MIGLGVWIAGAFITGVVAKRLPDNALVILVFLLLFWPIILWNDAWSRIR